MNRQKSPQKLNNWKQWLIPRPIDGMAALLYLGVLFVYGYFTLTGVYPLARPLLGIATMVAAALLMITIDRLEYWYYGEQPPWRTTLTYLLLRMAIIMLAGFSDGLGWSFYHDYFTIIIFFTIFFLSGNSYGLSGVVWMFYLLDRWWHTTTTVFADVEYHGPDEPIFVFYVIFAMILLFIFSIAYLIRQERISRIRTEKLLTELELSHQRLQKYASQVSELATIEERNRLAREIHDSLGHYMTVINVQLEKAIAFRERNSNEADQAIKNAKHLAAESLKDVRQSVGALRSTPEAFLLAEALNGLVAHMRNEQLTIDLNIEGNESDFSQQSLVTLYRAGQEGLTNIQKHAQASRITIDIKLKNNEASLSIVDNGQGFDTTTLNDSKMDTHYGLQGIRERLELIRGSLQLDSAPHQGTSLRVTVPKNPLLLVGG